MSDNNLYMQAQEWLVAALIYDGEPSTRIFDLIQVDDFSDPKFNTIMGSINAISRRDEIVSAVSVANELSQIGMLETVGGTSELMNLKILGEKYLLDGTHELYANVIREASAKYKITKLFEESKESFTDDSGVSAIDGVSEIQSNLGDIIFNLADNSTMTDVSKYVGDYMDILDDRRKISDINSENGTDMQGIPTMLPSLNEYTSGWGPGQLITVGARTGVGKSAFAIMSAVAACRAGKSVLFFSLEMSAEELVNRVISLMAGVSGRKLKTGRIDEEEKERISKAVQDLSQMKLFIDEEAGATIDSIRAKSLNLAQSESGLDMVIVDYLQLVKAGGKFNNRQEEVAEVSRNTKLLSKVLTVPVMILVQLKRASGEEADDKLPIVDDIRESGSIAQDSDVVILIHREVALDGTTPQTLIILAKQRSGPANKMIRCHTNLEYSNFSEIRRDPDLSNENIGDQGDNDLDFSLDTNANKSSSEFDDLDFSKLDLDIDFDVNEEDNIDIDF